jgi:uncharacterized protein (DUF427 family)
MTTRTSTRGRVRVEPCGKRLRAYLDGQLVVDTIHALYVWEVPYYPYYYVPAADMRAELVATGRTTRSPSRGEAQHHDVQLGSSVARDAALTYPDSPLEDLRDQVRLDWNSMSAWFEEDEEIFFHARSPYARIDILPTSRHVRVEAGDTVLAESSRAHVLFETGLMPRWYIPKLDVRMDLLTLSETITHCPYKGTPVHYGFPVQGEGEEMVDVAWSYPTPLPESERIAGLVAFYDNRVRVLVDGEPTR